MSVSGRSRLLLGALLLLLVFAAYGRSISNGFVHDDHQLVERNPLVHELNPATHIGSTFWARGEKLTEYYRPLTSWSWAVERSLFGATPRGYHFGGLLVHGLNSILLFLLLGRLTQRSVAWIAAAIFAVHPVQTEVVVWVAAWADLLSTCLLLTALWFYARIPDRPGKRDLASCVLLALVFALALLAKESAVTFPALAIGFDLARRRAEGDSWTAAFRATTDRLKRLGAIYFSLIAGYLLLRWGVVGQLFGVQESPAGLTLHPLAEAPLKVRLLTAVDVAARYLKLLLFPLDLTVDYKFDVVPLVRSIFSLRLLLALLATTGAAVGTLLFARRRPAVLFGLLAGVGSYALLSHIFFAAPLIMAERVLYLPLVGGSIILAALLARVAEVLAPPSRRGALLITLALALLLALGARSYIRTGDWRDDLSLFSTAVEVAPRSTLAWNNLGHARQAGGDRQGALEAFGRSLAIYPRYLPARLNHAAALLELQQLEAAERELREILAEHPDAGDGWLNLTQLLTQRAERHAAEGEVELARSLYGESAELALQQAERVLAREQRGGAAALLLIAAQSLSAQGDRPRAETLFSRAVELSHTERGQAADLLRSGILSNFALFLVQSERPQEAAPRFAQAAEAAAAAGSPLTAARILLDESRAWLLTNRSEDALAALYRAGELASENPALLEEIYVELARLLARQGDLQAAVALAESEALDSTPSILVLRVAAEAAFQSGYPSAALPVYDRILDLDPEADRARLGRARSRLMLGDLNGAEQDLSRLVNKNPGGRIEAAIWTDLARIAIMRGESDSAMRRLERALSADPDFGMARYQRGLVLLQAGNSAAAEGELTAALALGLPDAASTAEAWFNLAELAREHGAAAVAAERYRRCLAIQPQHTRALEALSRISHQDSR